MIWGFIGPEGGGKTSAMTYFSLLHIIEGGKVLAFPGYKVKGDQGEVLSQPTSPEEWITLSEELKFTITCVDEAQNFFDARRWNSALSRIVSYAGMQRRKRQFGLLYTLQEWGWIDQRLRWLTHLLTICRDLYHSPWGKEEGFKRGELFSLTTYDCKGFYTGNPWELMRPMLLKGIPLRPHFESFAHVDIFAAFTHWKMKAPTTTINLVDEEAPDDPLSSMMKNKVAEEDRQLVGLDSAMVNELASQGVSARTISRLDRAMRK